MLLEDSTQVRVRGINSKGYRSTGFRVSKDGNRGKKELGRVEGRVEHG